MQSSRLISHTPRASAIRAVWLAVILVLPATGLCAGEASAARPNIIVIATDDQGWADTGYNGDPGVKTPNIDRLAASGIRFDNGYATAPQCIPSRAGIILGRYQQRFGVECNPDEQHHGNYQLPSGVSTLPQELQKAGYRTGMVGKWHLGEPTETQPFNKGFEWCAYFREGMGFQYAANGKEKLFRNERDEVIPLGPDEYLVDVFTRKGLEFLGQQDERPFFLYLSYYPPHWPLAAPERYLERYKDIDDVHRRTACAMISSVDDAVGQVMARLAESGLAENTMVVFLSDNGAPEYSSRNVVPIKVGQNASSNGPLSGYKGNLLEGGIRVPFLLSWPGRLPANAAVPWPVSTLDLTPTFLAAAGAPPMKDADGVDLIPYLQPTVSRTGPDRALFWRFYTQQCLQAAVRRGPWKWVSAGPEPGQGFDFPDGSLRSNEIALFNIFDDPSEKRNVIDQNPAIAASLAREFGEWNKKLVDPKWVTLHSEKSGR